MTTTNTPQMRKIIIRSPGGYDKLELISEPVPSPQNDQVLVRVKCSGVNYADVIVRWGFYQSAKKFVGWPITPGFEFSGVIEKVGSAVTSWKVGDEVVGISLFGGYADHVCIAPHMLFPKPNGWSFAQAASFPAIYLTAYHALLQNIVIRKGSTLLIHSAAGGVGGALLQFSKILGFSAVGVVGSAHKVEAAKKMGADHVIDKSTQDLWAEAERISPAGYDVVLDANGVTTLKQSWNHVGMSGRLVVYGYHSMLPRKGGKIRPHHYLKLALDFLRTPTFHPMRMTDGNKSLISFNISFLWDRKDLINEAMTDILRWIGEGKLTPPPTQGFAATSVAEAHQRIESGQSVGKIVLNWES